MLPFKEVKYGKQILPGKKLSGKKQSGKELSGKALSGRKLPGKKLSGKKQPGKELSGKALSGRKLPGKNLILAGDIGGTNSNFGILREQHGKPELLLSLHFKSKNIRNFTVVVKEVLDYVRKKYHFSPKQACFAGAGPVTIDSISMTNAPFTIQRKDLLQKTALKSIVLINDVQAIGYGIDSCKKMMVQVQKGKLLENGSKIIVGAGTGLGKSIMNWDVHSKQYLSFPSEGGHADAVPYTPEESALFDFIREKRTKSIEWEHLLSGRGIQHIYQFLGKQKTYKNTKYSCEIQRSGYDPVLIARYHHKDKRCRDTMAIFVRFYARCAKNFALETMALGGVYLSGGIAAKNLELFTHKTFKNEFCLSRTQAALLANIPVYVITDYNISLYGAGVAAQLHKKEVIR